MTEPVHRSWPVVEIFGPTVQGEGIDQGVPCHFVRFGGCDYRCEWCDTPHAVLPEEVRRAQRMDERDILQRLRMLNEDRAFVPWVILSGGNPALHDLTKLVRELQVEGYKVAVETQGSKWIAWFNEVDRLCISPKPPSSKEKKASRIEDGVMYEFNRSGKLHPPGWMFFKIVIFDEEDLRYAEKFRENWPGYPLYLSAGNDAGKTVGNPDRIDTRSEPEVKLQLLDRSEWLVQQVFQRPVLCASDVTVQSQYHVLLWGNRQGV